MWIFHCLALLLVEVDARWSVVPRNCSSFQCAAYAGFVKSDVDFGDHTACCRKLPPCMEESIYVPLNMPGTRGILHVATSTSCYEDGVGQMGCQTMVVFHV